MKIPVDKELVKPRNGRFRKSIEAGLHERIKYKKTVKTIYFEEQDVFIR
jgi:hypothetical protein